LNLKPQSSLTLLHLGEPDAALHALAGWARFWGLGANLAQFGGSPRLPGGSVLIDASSLASAGGPPPDLERLNPGVPFGRQMILIRDARPATLEWVQAASHGTIVDLQRRHHRGPLRFHALPAGAGAELNDETLPRDSGSALCLHGGPGAIALLAASSGNSWLQQSEGPAQGLQVWGGLHFLNPDHFLANEREIEGRLDTVLPLLAFLRRVHGPACWHNPHRHLGIVIDDPLLVPRYGCLDFPTLLQSARKVGLHVTLAFIPWNAPRTRPADAIPFREQSDIFSVCLHGCDHTGGEYASTDDIHLRTLNREALSRMQVHERRTGLETQPLMVCPQERFSRAALAAVGSEPGIEALVNSRFLPRDHTPSAITVADLLKPAFDGYHGCTLLKRFYPEERWKIALGQFLGQPSLLVEHHAYFRQGMARLEAEISCLRSITPALTSPPITTVVRQTHWRRVAGPGHLEIRSFTRRLDFEVDAASPTHVTVQRRLDPTFPLQEIQLDGHAVGYQRTGSQILLHLPALEPGRHRLELIPASVTPPPAYAPTRPQRIRIVCRRALSELRDLLTARVPFQG
jgi:hypothetical protein